MSDPYFFPKTLAKSHERIRDILHTNKTQAETIGEMRSEIEKLKLLSAKAECNLTIYKVKWERLRKIHLGLKAVLASLSATGDDFEDYDKESES